MQRNPSNADLISSKMALRQAKANNTISLQFKANSLSRRRRKISRCRRRLNRRRNKSSRRRRKMNRRKRSPNSRLSRQQLCRRKLFRIKLLSMLFLIIRKREQSLDSLLLMESAYSSQWVLLLNF